MKATKKVTLVVVACLTTVEIILRISGVFRTAEERRGKPYASSYGEVRNSWYKNHKAYYTFTPPVTDFHYPFSTNQFGLREKDYGAYPSDSVYRILITGNSYIEGMGAPYDSTWPRLLEGELRSRNLNVEVIDAGLSGNDILYDYVYYRDSLNADYHPDLVIGTMNSSDYVYYTFRGGMERFHKDGTVHYLPAPWYDFLFHYSHFFRGILALGRFPVEGAYVSKNNYRLLTKKATSEFGKEIKNYHQQALKNNAKFVCIFYPKIQDLRHDFFIKNSLDNFSQLSKILDSAGVSHFSLFKSFSSVVAGRPEGDYSYHDNGHYKPEGYLMMARLTADSLIASGVIKK
jgi:hypothetical protein